MKKLVIYYLVAFIFTSCQVVQQLNIPTPNTDVFKKKKSTPAITAPVANIIIEKPALIIGSDSIMADAARKELLLALDSLSAGDEPSKQKILKDYLQSRLLLAEAKRVGYLNDPVFREELESYRSVLADAYFSDSVLVESLVRETYNWLQEEIRASHILFSLSEFAPPADTVDAYNKAFSVRSRILNGETFEDIAKAMSSDRKTASYGGDLGYFTALQIAYPIEKSAYNTPLGGVSLPVRSKYGYHLIQIKDRRPTRGRLKVAHIMAIANSKSSSSIKFKAKEKIDSVYTQLKAGGVFEELCKQFSEDKNTKDKGGVLPTFGLGKYEEKFENIAFGLKKEEISEPVQSSSGWHILKLLDTYPLESFEQMKDKLRDKVVTDSRGEFLREQKLQRIKTDFRFSEKEGIFNEIYARLDTNLLNKKWRFNTNDQILNKTLFSVEGKNYLVKPFFDYVVENQKMLKITTSTTQAVIIRNLYKQFVEDELHKYAENHIEQQIPTFAALMHSYKTDILKARLMNDLVYRKSVQDTVGQRIYYEQHKDLYRLPERVNVTILECADSKTFYQVKEVIAKDPPYALKVKLKNDLYFGQNESKLNADHHKNLIGLVATMKKNKNYVAEIGGYADVSEGDTVSASRLKEVVTFLTRNGLDLPRIIENDYARTKQLAADASKNRRVVVQFSSNSKEDLARTFNAKTPNSVKITERTYMKGDLALLDSLEWKQSIKRYDLADKIIELNINFIEPPRYKTLAESRGAVIKAYQAELRQNFEADLRKRYPIQVNEEELKKVF